MVINLAARCESFLRGFVDFREIGGLALLERDRQHWFFIPIVEHVEAVALIVRNLLLLRQEKLCFKRPVTARMERFVEPGISSDFINFQWAPLLKLFVRLPRSHDLLGPWRRNVGVVRSIKRLNLVPRCSTWMRSFLPEVLFQLLQRNLYLFILLRQVKWLIRWRFGHYRILSMPFFDSWHLVLCLEWSAETRSAVFHNVQVSLAIVWWAPEVLTTTMYNVSFLEKLLGLQGSLAIDNVAFERCELIWLHYVHVVWEGLTATKQVWILISVFRSISKRISARQHPGWPPKIIQVDIVGLIEPGQQLFDLWIRNLCAILDGARQVRDTTFWADIVTTTVWDNFISKPAL